ncbi:MAG: hypothetical protein KC457_25765 [Myxococcales bacterium]|nr:hypothetical protein [Myxococcales bacterium]
MAEKPQTPKADSAGNNRVRNFLLGWVLESADERALADMEAERERQIGETWAIVFARER